jgi:predicted AlkP superfamily pyrophosphatase or phosphodiesterase
MWWWWWFALIFVLYKSSFVHNQSLPLLLLVSFDGFRFDYPKIYGPLQSFSRLELSGVHAHSMMSTFNTATFPNDYTYVYLFIY